MRTSTSQTSIRLKLRRVPKRGGFWSNDELRVWYCERYACKGRDKHLAQTTFNRDGLLDRPNLNIFWGNCWDKLEDRVTECEIRELLDELFERIWQEDWTKEQEAPHVRWAKHQQAEEKRRRLTLV